MYAKLRAAALDESCGPITGTTGVVDPRILEADLLPSFLKSLSADVQHEAASPIRRAEGGAFFVSCNSDTLDMC